MIFQNLALYPDKTVFENIAFPLKQQDVAEDEIQERVTSVAKQLKVDWLLEKLPSQLSGGERQRVAIGRAIVRQPKAYLMDEPLSNLDALLRLEMRVALKELQTNLKETFVYVTHDQVEALSMGDRIAVLNEGVLQQVDDPATIYRSPSNMFVATILGNPPMNFLHCELKRDNGSVMLEHRAFKLKSDNRDVVGLLETGKDRGNVVLGLRPEDIHIHKEKPGDSSIQAQIYVIEPLGNETIVDIKIGEDVIKVLAESDFSGDLNQDVWINFNNHKLHLFNEQSQECLYHATDKSSFAIV
jgi:multiple sugar transport system ATP-binding protein